MTIITHCNHCSRTIAILWYIVGDVPTGTFFAVKLDDTFLKCIKCTSNDVSLRMVGDTCTFNQGEQSV